MSLNAVRGEPRHDDDIASEPFAIGLAADANIFGCPRCGRPQAVGNSRCAGCGLRMVDGLPFLRVSRFIAGGLLIGMLVGGGMVGAITWLTRPVDKSVVQAPATVTPSVAPGAPIAAPTVDPAIPRAAVSALRQTTTLNQRLLADARRLTRALANRPSGAEIAPVLRSIASTASLGDGVAPTVAQWPEGAAVSRALVALYAAAGRVADDGLAASVKNDRAYINTAKQMRTVLARLTDLDASSRALALGAGIELPPLVPAAR
jgi:hypothetical protein